MENKYFKRISLVKPIYNINTKWENGFVELWSGWAGNLNQESREEMVATIASLSYGNEQAKDPAKLYKRLQVLKHESVFEFITPAYFSDRIRESLRHENLPTFEQIADGDKDILTQLMLDHASEVATFKIKCPIFVARQFMRHRGASYLEMSRRYVKNNKVPFEFYMPEMENYNSLDYGDRQNIERMFEDTYNYITSVYEKALETGLKPEQARAIQPVGAYTIFWVQMDKDSLVNFFNLRLKKDAQEEIRKIALAMLNSIKIYQTNLYENIIKEL